jgi:DNA-binding CsgD family transcriptional regulator/tetratricopeptide (TPR) repeat protein
MDAAGELGVDDDPDLGLLWCREALRLIQEINDRIGVAGRLRRQGSVHLFRGDIDAARRCQREALAVSVVGGDSEGEAWAHFGLGELALASDQLRDARGLLLEAMRRFEATDIAFGVYAAQIVLAAVERAAGRWDDAVRSLDQAVMSQHLHDYRARYGEVLEVLAAVAGELDEGETAGRLCGAATGWRSTFDEPDPAPYHRQAHAQSLVGIRRRLGDQAWRAAYRDGQRLAPALVTRLADDVVTQLRYLLTATPAGLTQREVEVLRQVAFGLDSVAVAGRLAISPRTVHAHLRSIFDKLGVGTRTAAAREAGRLNLA